MKKNYTIYIDPKEKVEAVPFPSCLGTGNGENKSQTNILPK